MPDLIAPTARLRNSWFAARKEWGSGVYQEGSGLRDTDDVHTAAGFAAWVERLRQQSEESIAVAAGRVPATFWWIVEDDVYLGAITLRHCLNDLLLEAGGHIGYGVRPSARRRGLATWALGEVLPKARAQGIDRVLVTCLVDNVASARTIQRNGGVLEDVRDTELGLVQRYWIDLRPDPQR